MAYTFVYVNFFLYLCTLKQLFEFFERDKKCFL